MVRWWVAGGLGSHDRDRAGGGRSGGKARDDARVRMVLRCERDGDRRWARESVAVPSFADRYVADSQGNRKPIDRVPLCPTLVTVQRRASASVGKTRLTQPTSGFSLVMVTGPTRTERSYACLAGVFDA